MEALVELDEAEAPTVRKRPTSGAPPAISLPGDSAAWRTALDVSSRIARDGLRAVIVGEAGTGKFTVAREWRACRAVESRWCSECRELRREGALVPAIRAAAESGATIVLLHLEAPDDADVFAARSWVDALPVADRPWLLATLTTGDDAEDGLSARHQLLAERFAGAVIALPSLQQRPDDVPSIARALVTCSTPGDAMCTWPPTPSGCSPSLVGRATSGSWRTSCASPLPRARREVRAADLPPEVQRKTVRRSMSLIEQTECDVIVHALHAAAGNKAEAARLIGLSRSTIYRKIRAYGLDRDRALLLNRPPRAHAASVEPPGEEIGPIRVPERGHEADDDRLARRVCDASEPDVEAAAGP